MFSYLEILCGLAAVLGLLYYYFTATFDLWKKLNIQGPTPMPLVGNFADIILERLSPGDYLKKLYDAYPNESMIGIYARTSPLLILKDPNLIKDVLIKDFSKFADRGFPLNEKADPLSLNLLTLESKRWRPLRTKLSPIFTSGKLKDMFAMILDCSEHLEKHLEKLVEKGEPIEVRDLSAKFTTDVIGNCAFGIEMNALNDRESKFRQMGREIFQPTGFQRIRTRLRQAAPSLYLIIGRLLPRSELADFFISLVRDTIKYRKENNIVRNDFIDTLVDIQDHPEKLGDIEVTAALLAAQAFLFFAAGFETSSTAMSNTLYELAMHHDIQDKLREEIKETFKKNNGDLQYQTIKEMKFLDAVFRESLRKYPPATFLSRQANTDYTFEGTKITIPKGTRIWIPTYGIHHDPKIYPEPDKFDPGRFIDEEKANRHPMQYLPFGDGPRNCIGARFAVYQTKIGLIKILHHYKVDICKETPIPYAHQPRSFLLTPIGGIPLKITKIEEKKT